MADTTTKTSAKCDNTDCNAPTPWDMAAIHIDDKSYCTPSCAQDHLKITDTVPQSVALHDPQYNVDRAELPASVSEDAVNIQRDVTNSMDAAVAIEEIADMYPGDFRSLADERANIKVSNATKAALDSVKKDSETWDECLTRLVALERASQVTYSQADT